MDEARGSDISKTQLDLVDLTANDLADDDSLHPPASKGFCVKDYEEKMSSLEKENFNLKFRIYLLQEKNPNVPEGAEELYKQNIDLKVLNEELKKDIEERSDLLCKASKALELLEEQKAAEMKHSELLVDEMNQKIESLQHEVASLQNALTEVNKSTLGNDTGYADYFGAVDSKDVEHQRNLMKRDEHNRKLQQELDKMNEKFEELQRERKEIDAQTSELLYENNELKDRMSEVEKSMVEQQKLQQELRQFKDKWASAQCDLQDTEEKLKATEKERQKTLDILQKTLEALEAERIKSFELENRNGASGGHHDRTKNAAGGTGANSHLLAKKNKEISDMTHELNDAKRRIEELSTQKHDDKNRTAETSLCNLLGSMQLGRNSLGPNFSRASLEQLSTSFNELKMQQATEEKKATKQKIDSLMNEIADVANSKTKQHVAQLQKQIASFNQKQEVTDKAFETCVELCALSLEHLQGLAQFLSALIQQKEIRESISEMTMFNIQATLNKTFELSNAAGRFSIDGRLSSLPDLSSLDVLMTAARDSLINVREVQHSNKSIQASNNESVEALQAENMSARKELEEFKQINQLLEDEICHLKESMEDYKLKLTRSEENAAELQQYKDKTSVEVTNIYAKFKDVEVNARNFEKTLHKETELKKELVQRVYSSEAIAKDLKQKLDHLQKDIEANWVPKAQHNEMIQRLEGEIVNEEALIAAVRLQMEALQVNLDQIKANEGLPSGSAPYASSVANDSSEDVKENFAQQSALRPLDISEDRKLLLTSNVDSAESSSTGPPCANCPKYQTKIVELKKYLSRAMDKIKSQSEARSLNDRHIQKQLNTTETFLSKARSNMENILKNRNSQQE